MFTSLESGRVMSLHYHCRCFRRKTCGWAASAGGQVLQGRARQGFKSREKIVNAKPQPSRSLNSSVSHERGCGKVSGMPSWLVSFILYLCKWKLWERGLWSFFWILKCVHCVRAWYCLFVHSCLHDRGQLARASSLLLPFLGFRGTNSGCHPCVSSAFYWLRHPVNHWFLRQGFTR